jgi:hypothetical protein
MAFPCLLILCPIAEDLASRAAYNLRYAPPTNCLETLRHIGIAKLGIQLPKPIGRNFGKITEFLLASQCLLLGLNSFRNFVFQHIPDT